MCIGNAIPDRFTNPGISGLSLLNPGIPGLIPGLNRARLWLAIAGLVIGKIATTRTTRYRLSFSAMTLLVGSIFHVTRKIVSEMTYNVSMGTLNPTIPYHTRYRLNCAMHIVIGRLSCAFLHWRVVLFSVYCKSTVLFNLFYA